MFIHKSHRERSRGLRCIISWWRRRLSGRFKGGVKIIDLQSIYFYIYMPILHIHKLNKGTERNPTDFVGCRSKTPGGGDIGNPFSSRAAGNGWICGRERERGSIARNQWYIPSSLFILPPPLSFHPESIGGGGRPRQTQESEERESFAPIIFSRSRGFRV